MSLNQTIALGIDVCKLHLDVCHTQSARTHRFDNSCSGIAQLIQWLSRMNPTDIIVIEASGGYEQLCWMQLNQAGLAVARINPKRARDFARASGVLAKTDALDARVLAQFGQCFRPAPTPIKSRHLQHLHALLVRRTQLVDMRTSEKNRRLNLPPLIARNIDQHLRQLERHIQRIDQHIEQRVQADPRSARIVQLIQPIKGLATQTCSWLIADMPELGQLNRQKISALAGLAPYANESGAYKGKRRIRGGRKHARTALFMATLSAIQHEPVFRAFYRRLVDAGKPKKVAITATMRKLLTVINAIVKSGQPFDPNAYGKSNT